LLTENTLLVLAGLKRLIDTDSLARKWVEHNAAELASKSPQTDSARKWLNLNVSFSKGALRDALAQVYGSGWAFGTVDGLDQLSGGVGDPWADWNAGNEAAAALVDPPKGLQSLLDKSNITIEGISNTILDQIGSNLADSLSQGLGAQDTADNLSEIIDNPLKAMVIARTESARAISDSNVASYQDYGVKQISWLASDPCNICAINDGQVVDIGDQFNSGDLYPPAHPNCVCDVTPVSQIDIGDGSGVDAVDGVLSVSPDGEDDIIHDGVVDGGKFVDSDLGKYSPDQPRDSHGRFGEGGEKIPNSLDNVSSTHTENLHNLWGTVITTTADGMGDEVVANISDSIDPSLPEPLTSVNAITDWANNLDVRSAVKATVANDVLQQDSMKSVATQDLIEAAAGRYRIEYGVAFDTVGKVPEEWSNALATQPEQSGYDAEGEYHGINVVELNAQGEINVADFTDVTPNIGSDEGVTHYEIQEEINQSYFESTSRFAIAGTPEAEALVREAATSTLINQWAQTSNDSSPVSLAMQQAAADQFHLDDAAKWEINSEQTLEQKLNLHVDSAYAANGDVYRSFLQAQYDNTQEQLKAAGIESLTVYRGSKIGDADVSEVTTRPMSSWSTSFEVAANFSNGGVIYRTEIPASQIMSTAGTGFGCLNEFEIVALGGTRAVDAMSDEKLYNNAAAYTSAAPDGSLQEDGKLINQLFENAKVK